MVRRVTLSIKEEVLGELRRLAKAHGMSLSRFVTKALEEFVIENRKRKAGMELLELIKSRKLVSNEAGKELERMREEWER